MTSDNQLNSKKTVEEVSDYDNAVQFIEAQQRHDLAVHLYSTFLMHRVNPHFPPPEWASWPLAGRHILDPKMAADSEDVVVPDTEYAGLDTSFFKTATWAAPRGHHEGSHTVLQHTGETIEIHHKRRKVSSPRATLVNEMHYALQRRLKTLVTKKNRIFKGDNVLSLADDSQLMQNMATRLANRLNRVLQQLESRPRRHIAQVTPEQDKSFRKMNSNYKLHSHYKRTWQDVLLADYYDEKLNASVVNVEGLRRMYLKMRSIFRFMDYPYEYDPESYSETDLNGTEVVPPFSMSGNLEAIEEAGTGPVAIEETLKVISQRKTDEVFKERVFMGLLYQTIIEKRLLWLEPDGTGDHYSPSGDDLIEQRQEVMRDVHLKIEDYTM